MAITATQKAMADQQQQLAATDSTAQVRLIAGPGTGKSGTIIKRILHLLGAGADPKKLFVISFTRAACEELRGRVKAACAQSAFQQAADQIHVSTMHSLALAILKRANLLTQYPADPMILDDWEQDRVYDAELSGTVGCTPTRAAEIRLAHDAAWQTLNSAAINQSQISPQEQQAFQAFHATRTHLYSCVLPGEVVFRCVDHMRMGALQAAQLSAIDHLIVDEYQDLNACDQEFVRLLATTGAVLFVAGDDDQSIYSFRHANPAGIVQFQASYPNASTHVLTDCFRCTPDVLAGASALISYNPVRVPKKLTALYATASPPVQGRLEVWSFSDAAAESAAIASSCDQLIKAGFSGREDEIVILISNRRVQLDILTQELGNLGLPFDPPTGGGLAEVESLRAVFCLLRIARDHQDSKPDYPAHRALLCLFSGVGQGTVKSLGDDCVANNQNFHDMFYLPSVPHWLTARQRSAIGRARSCTAAACAWSLKDTLAQRANDIQTLLQSQVFTSGNQVANHISTWTSLVNSLPGGMTLEELVELFGARSEADQQTVLDAVNQRLAVPQPGSNAGLPGKKIRILTMHGAKGLSGKVVFIPSAEQGIMPSFRSLQATGLLIEQRRLFYVSLTRAMACCIVSHAGLHTVPSAFLLQQKPAVRLSRSQFLNEMGVASRNRGVGLSPQEAAQIWLDVSNL